MQIVVLGMHRSGTSLVTRLIHEMGAYAGEEADLLPTNDHNPGGFWERADVIRLNDELLHAGGASWCRVSDFQPSAIPSHVLAHFREAATTIIQGMDTRGTWVVKDPRLCMTFPIWREVLRKPVCILVHRDPIEIARSLRTRDRFPGLFSLALWEQHMLSALAASAKSTRMMVSYNDLLAEPERMTQSLLKKLASIGAIDLESVNIEVLTSSIESELYREQGAGTLKSGLNPAQVKLSKALQSGFAFEWEEIPWLSDGAFTILRDYEDLAAEIFDVVRFAEERGWNPRNPTSS